MHVIHIDLGSDGSYHVMVSSEELSTLYALNREYGTIHDAMNKMDTDEESYKMCKRVLNRVHISIPSFVFYC